MSFSLITIPTLFLLTTSQSTYKLDITNPTTTHVTNYNPSTDTIRIGRQPLTTQSLSCQYNPYTSTTNLYHSSNNILTLNSISYSININIINELTYQQLSHSIQCQSIATTTEMQTTMTPINWINKTSTVIECNNDIYNNCSNLNIMGINTGDILCNGINSCENTLFNIISDIIGGGLAQIKFIGLNSFKNGWIKGEIVSRVTCNDGACVNSKFDLICDVTQFGGCNMVCDGINSCPMGSTNINGLKLLECKKENACISREFNIKENAPGSELSFDGIKSGYNVIINGFNGNKINCRGIKSCENIIINNLLIKSIEIDIVCDAQNSCKNAKIIFNNDNPLYIKTVKLALHCLDIGACNNIQIIKGNGIEIINKDKPKCDNQLYCINGKINNDNIYNLAKSIAFNSNNHQISNNNCNQSKNMNLTSIILIILMSISILVLITVLIFVFKQKNELQIQLNKSNINTLCDNIDDKNDDNKGLNVETNEESV